VGGVNRHKSVTFVPIVYSYTYTLLSCQHRLPRPLPLQGSITPPLHTQPRNHFNNQEVAASSHSTFFFRSIAMFAAPTSTVAHITHHSPSAVPDQDHKDSMAHLWCEGGEANEYVTVLTASLTHCVAFSLHHIIPVVRNSPLTPPLASSSSSISLTAPPPPPPPQVRHAIQ
jgi:hypothetical protein